MCKYIRLNTRLWVCLFAFFFGLVIVEWSSLADNSDLDTGPISSFLTVLVGLFIGAIVSKTIYDYINRESQDRQWKHDYALTRVREIYGPLWDETQEILNALRNFEEPIDLQREYRSVDGSRNGRIGYKQMKDSHLGIFIDGNAKDLMGQFHDSADDYSRDYNNAGRDIYAASKKKALQVPKDATVSGFTSEMIEAFRGNPRVVYDSSEDIVHSRRSYCDAHEHISGSHKNADDDFVETLTILRNLESVKIVRRRRAAGILKGEKALGRLKKIIRDPASVVLDFGED